jgi:uncharacterized protein YxeA
MAEAESKNAVTSMILVIVIGSIMIAVTIFGMIKLYRYYNPEIRAKKEPEQVNYKEVDDTQFSSFNKTAGRNSELEMQYDPNNEFVQIHTEYKQKHRVPPQKSHTQPMQGSQ